MKKCNTFAIWTKYGGYWPVWLTVFLALFIISPQPAAAGPMPGAIFTTTVDGSIVNENVRYNKKEDVYLDGGPGPNAPSKAAGLDEGWYFFQVTDPSGKDLLSTDNITCRKIYVNSAGVIADYDENGTNWSWERVGQGKDAEWMWVSEPCAHDTGIDIDHTSEGAITVQLFPYDDTPNNGGVYKVWVTPVDMYAGVDFDPNGDKRKNVNGELWQPGNFHGFIPAWSKTDNYKVKNRGRDPDPSWLTIKKFHDRNLDGVWNEGEEEIFFWAVDVMDPLGVENTYYTPVMYQLLVAGDHSVTEETPPESMQTVSYLNGGLYTAFPTADPTVEFNYSGGEAENHEVTFGNVGVADPTICKIYDLNANGIRDEGEVGVPGWKFALSRLDTYGNVLERRELVTGEDGCVSFGGLIPGNYRIEEIFPPASSWQVSPGSPTSIDFQVVSVLEQYEDGYKLYGQVLVNGENFNGSFNFFNLCVGTADFDTKGYWHNKNGLGELDETDRDFVNALSPYSSASAYFEAGDEPFDGMFSGGAPVAAAFSDGSEIWASGTWQSEVSHFLVDSNSDADFHGHREQLAQQLLAFIFNTRHNLGGSGASILGPGGEYINAQDLINDAIIAWESGSVEERVNLAGLLDWFNNNDAVQFVFENPCPVIYE